MSSGKKTPEDHIPLTPRTFHILLALIDGVQHPYAIMKEVEARSDGKVRIGPGTLYEAIGRLVDQEFLREVAEGTDVPDDKRKRRFYELTPLGRQVLRLEAKRLAQLMGYVFTRDLSS